MRRLTLALALIPFLAADAAAQIYPRGGLRYQEPAAWASLGAALVQPWTVHDGTTGTRWDFGDATQYVASLEKNLSGATLGVRGTTARVPLRYNYLTSSLPATDADANVSQLFATLHVASGREFHSVLEVSLGATLYSDFRERGTNTKLQPTSDTDFSFGFGYGLGYNFSPTFAIDVVQDLTTVVHQKSGLSAGEGSTARINGTRLIARFGLGSR